ncbi:MAG: SURF1 family protein, partial [Novosphingobium sp.]|nr:SURF1 family protein [Novosphingobium sp.]
MRRLPVVPTLLVLAAVAVMIRFGFWQLDRLHQKEKIIAQYQDALANRHISDLGRDLLIDGPFEYTRVRLQCLRPTKQSLQAGHNSRGESGWAQVVRCPYHFKLRGVREANIVIGWSRAPVVVGWEGGDIQGTVVPSKEPPHLRIVADPPLAGLEPNARPNPADIPNNHLSYAVQWFLFAATALVIYALALR